MRLCAYDSMRRRSELVALRIEDIEWGSNQSISILLRKSKTDQHGSGNWIHLGERASDAIKLWVESSKITEGFIFRGITQHQKLNMDLCDGQVGRIFKSLARKAKLGQQIIKQISGHSMRVGSAQDLLIKGASLPQIMVKGGWVKTDTAMRYVERINRPIKSIFDY